MLMGIQGLVEGIFAKREVRKRIAKYEDYGVDGGVPRSLRSAAVRFLNHRNLLSEATLNALVDSYKENSRDTYSFFNTPFVHTWDMEPLFKTLEYSLDKGYNSVAANLAGFLSYSGLGVEVAKVAAEHNRHDILKIAEKYSARRLKQLEDIDYDNFWYHAAQEFKPKELDHHIGVLRIAHG